MILPVTYFLERPFTNWTRTSAESLTSFSLVLSLDASLPAIRQQLDKHRNTPACASCHVHIDPPGFALENFDAIGGWRDFYRATKPTKKGVVKGQRYYHGPDVEIGGVTPTRSAVRASNTVSRDTRAVI